MVPIVQVFTSALISSLFNAKYAVTYKQNQNENFSLIRQQNMLHTHLLIRNFLELNLHTDRDLPILTGNSLLLQMRKSNSKYLWALLSNPELPIHTDSTNSWIAINTWTSINLGSTCYNDIGVNRKFKQVFWQHCK